MHSFSDEPRSDEPSLEVFPSFDHHRLFPYVNGEQAESVCRSFRPSCSY